MSNIESLYKCFKYCFDYDKKKIKYFLDVLKNVKEDKWEYEYKSLDLAFSKQEIKILKYDNIEIIYTTIEHYDRINYSTAFEDEIKVLVGNRKIFETDDETSELAIEIIDFIERVEKRYNGKTSR